MKIKLAHLEEKQPYWGLLGDYDNPDRYEEVWEEIDVTVEELVNLINNGKHIKVNCQLWHGS